MFGAGWLLSGCAEELPGCGPVGAHLALATTDYESGALAVLEPGGALCDRVASLGPDPGIRRVGSSLVTFDRTGGSSMQIWEPGAYGAPAVELALEPGVNVHDVVRVGDEWWLTAYERDELLRLSADGTPLPGVSLAEHADADGLPEADRFVWLEERLFVGLQRFDRDAGWVAGEGRVVELDPVGLSALGAWDVGPNPKLFPNPADPGSMLVATGRYGEPDGELFVLDPDEGPGPAVLREADLGWDLDGVAGIGGDLVVRGVDFAIGGSSRAECVALESGERTPAMEGDVWYVDAVAGADRVWVVSRTGWAGAPGDEVWAIDPAACSAELVAQGFTLDPFGAAWVPAASGAPGR